MSVCGRPKKTFKEASHVCFEGHLDDPSFRGISIQKIVGISDNAVTVEKSGELSIKKGKHSEIVSLTYKDWLFKRDVKTKGWPFKDENTKAIMEPATPTPRGNKEVRG